MTRRPLVLILLCLISAGPRLPDLGRAEWTVLEAETALLTAAPASRLVKLFKYKAEKYFSQPFLYIAGLRTFAGGRPRQAALRAPSAAAGIALTVLAYGMGAAFGGAAVAPVCGLLAALSSWGIVWSRSAGWEIFLLCAVVFYLLFLFRCLREERTGADWAGLTVGGILGTCLHPMFFFVVLAANLAAGVAAIRLGRRFAIPWAAVNAVVFAACGFWLPRWAAGFFQLEPGVVRFMGGLPLPGPGVLNAIFNLFNGYFHAGVFLSGYYLRPEFPGAVYLFGAVLFFIMAHVLFFKGMREYAGGLEKRVILAILFFLPVLANGFVAFGRMSLQQRMLPAMPVFFLIAAEGLVRFGGPRTWRGAWLCLAFLPLVSLPAVHRGESARFSWKLVAERAEDVRRPGDALVFLEGPRSAAFRAAMLPRPGDDYILFSPFDFQIAGDRFLQDEVVSVFGGSFDPSPPFLMEELTKKYSRIVTVSGADLPVSQERERSELLYLKQNCREAGDPEIVKGTAGGKTVAVEIRVFQTIPQEEGG